MLKIYSTRYFSVHYIIYQYPYFIPKFTSTVPTNMWSYFSDNSLGYIFFLSCVSVFRIFWRWGCWNILLVYSWVNQVIYMQDTIIFIDIYKEISQHRNYIFKMITLQKSILIDKKTIDVSKNNNNTYPIIVFDWLK